jgi:hypothetical protein
MPVDVAAGESFDLGPRFGSLSVHSRRPGLSRLVLKLTATCSSASSKSSFAKLSNGWRGKAGVFESAGS